MGFKSFLKLFS